MSTAASAAFELHPGCANDVDAVVEIMRRSFDPRFGEAWTRSQCLGILPLSGVRLTLASSPLGERVGFSLVRTIVGESELLLLAVLPEAQGCGIGQALVQDFICSSRNAGATRLHLEVRDGNPAIHTYRHAGFQLAGRRRAYYTGPGGEQFDALTLSREV